MSKPFDEVAPGSVEVALLGGKQSAVHVGIQNRRRWTGSCKSARVTIKWSPLEPS